MALRPFWARLKTANIHQMSKKFTRDMLRELFMGVVEDGIEVSLPLSNFRIVGNSGYVTGYIGIKPVCTLDLTTDVVITGVNYTSSLNGTQIQIIVNAAAANPTDTVLISVAKTAYTISITVTPNDGTNNSATPVGLTTAQLALAITGSVSGTYDGINCTITDSGGYLALFTATGGDATALAASGEGDEVASFLNGGQTPDGGILHNYSEPALLPVSETLQYDRLRWSGANNTKIRSTVLIPEKLDTANAITLKLEVSTAGPDTISFTVDINGLSGSAIQLTSTTMTGTTYTEITATIPANTIDSTMGNTYRQVGVSLTPNTHNNGAISLTSVRLVGNRT